MPYRRSAVLKSKNLEFNTASTALGSTPARNLFRHILPNSLAPIIVIATTSLASYIVAEATLSFLGVGLPTTTVSWGGDISSAQTNLQTDPLVLFYPSAALAITVLAFIMMGDAVKDALDPKSVRPERGEWRNIMTDNTNAKMLAMQKEHGPLLEVKDLAIDFTTDTGKPVHAVRDANFTVYPGQWVAIVGEPVPASPPPPWPCWVCCPAPVRGQRLHQARRRGNRRRQQSEFDKLRGTKMGLVPQDPMSNLNPVGVSAPRSRKH